VACAIYLGTYVATMAEVAVNKSSGRVEVKRVVCAQDEGRHRQSGRLAAADGGQHQPAPTLLLVAQDREDTDREPGGAGVGLRRTRNPGTVLHEVDLTRPDENGEIRASGRITRLSAGGNSGTARLSEQHCGQASPRRLIVRGRFLREQFSKGPQQKLVGFLDGAELRRKVYFPAPETRPPAATSGLGHVQVHRPAFGRASKADGNLPQIPGKLTDCTDICVQLCQAVPAGLTQQ